MIQHRVADDNGQKGQKKIAGIFSQFIRDPGTAEKRRILLLVLIMVIVAIVVGGVTVSLLYRTSIHDARARLVETARSQADLLAAAGDFDLKYSNDYPGGALAATLAKFHTARSNYEGFGATGEFTLAKLEDDNIIFIAKPRFMDLEQVNPIPFAAKVAEPMRRALSGQSGTLIGLDYRGITVLAAHESVAGMGLGIVAKIDLSEIRWPFLQTIGTATIFSLIIIGAGTFFFFRVSDPLIQKIQDNESRFRSVAQTAVDAIISADSAGNVNYWNPGAENIFGYKPEEILGRSLTCLMPENFRKAHQKGLETLLATGNARWIGKTVEVTGLRKDRQEFPLELSLATWSMGDERFFSAIIRDISIRKQAEKQTRQLMDSQQVISDLLHLAMRSMDLKNMLDDALQLLLAIPWLSIKRKGAIFLVSEGGTEL